MMNTQFARNVRKLMLVAGLVAASTWPLRAAALGVQSETLLQTTSAWDGTSYTAYPPGVPQPTVLRMTLPAHTVLPWHKHPMPISAYVVSGDLTVEKQDGTKQHFAAGQAFSETVNIVHRGVVGDQPVVLLLFYAGVKDMPLTIP
jgi:quercetin dioxygenase-like cupin family protein